MAFKTLEVARTRAKPLASISLRDKNETGEPTCRVGLRAELLAEFPLKDKDKFLVQIGNDADAGKLRFVRTRDTAGIAPRLIKGGAVFDLGHIPDLGGAVTKTPAKTEIIDANTLQIVLPFNTDEAPPRAASHDERSVTIVLDRGRMAHLEGMAAAAHAEVGGVAARLLAAVIDDDKASEAA
jgi:hypothetical protein